MIPKKRALHELPYKEIVKSGTIRLVSGQGLYCVTLPWHWPTARKVLRTLQWWSYRTKKEWHGSDSDVRATLHWQCNSSVIVWNWLYSTLVWTAVTERHYKESFTMELQYRYEKKEWHCSDNVKLIVEWTAVTEWHCSDIEQPAANFNFYNKINATEGRNLAFFRGKQEKPVSVFLSQISKFNLFFSVFVHRILTSLLYLQSLCWTSGLCRPSCLRSDHYHHHSNCTCRASAGCQACVDPLAWGQTTAGWSNHHHHSYHTQ